MVILQKCITRARYHRAVRHIVREGDRICTTKMNVAISENSTRDMWSGVRLLASVDGVVGDDEIAQLFLC